MTTLIKNGRIITASDDYMADILIEGETIKAIGKNLYFKADTVIDAGGLLVMPGGIDPHVHLEMPFMGTFSSDTYENRYPYCLTRRRHHQSATNNNHEKN